MLSPPEEELYGRPTAPVTAVAVSPCGNFGIVGSACGRIDRYNMQSGLHRGAYHRARPVPVLGNMQQQQRSGSNNGRRAAGPRPDAGLLHAHDSAVVGLGVDGSNKLLVSAGFDGVLRAWDFKAQK